MSDNTNNKNEELGALWKRESKNGQTKYLAGTLKLDVGGQEQTVKVVVFSNDKRGNDKAPDYRMYKQREMAQATTQSNEDDML